MLAYYVDRNVPAVKEFARIRAAGTHLSAINANAPAVLMTNGYGDSVFPPNQLVDFYGGLTGLIGLDNHVWTSAWWTCPCADLPGPGMSVRVAAS